MKRTDLHAQTKLAGSWEAKDRVFDNTTTAVVTFTPDNAGANAGADKAVTVTVASIALSGTDNETGFKALF